MYLFVLGANLVQADVVTEATVLNNNPHRYYYEEPNGATRIQWHKKNINHCFFVITHSLPAGQYQTTTNTSKVRIYTFKFISITTGHNASFLRINTGDNYRCTLNN